MSEPCLDYIVVEGPIGVGKTTLAKRLAESFGTELLLESQEPNPFLPRFYENPRATALPTQLFFLFQRARQIQQLRQTDMFRPVRVADFLMEKDQLFAQLTLDDDELKLYEQIYKQLTIDAPVPDLTIYLQAPVEVLLERIRKRGVSYEQLIDLDYLQRLVNSYVEFFYRYNAAPLLIVNVTDVNLVDGEREYEDLLDYIRHLKKGRHYFNPAGL